MDLSPVRPSADPAIATQRPMRRKSINKGLENAIGLSLTLSNHPFTTRFVSKVELRRSHTDCV